MTRTTNDMMKDAAVLGSLIFETMLDRLNKDIETKGMEDPSAGPISIEFESDGVRVSLDLSIIEAKGIIERLTDAIAVAESRGADKVSIITASA